MIGRLSFVQGSPVLGSVVLSSGAAAGSAVYKVALKYSHCCV